MFIVWMFIIAILLILLVYRIANKPSGHEGTEERGTPAPKPEPMKAAGPEVSQPSGEKKSDAPPSDAG